MKCPECQFENREGAKFCGKCGTKLSLICPQCHSENDQENNFCNECGQRLEKSMETEKVVSETEGERKHVTVLFSDLSGYITMSERLDPEEIKEIMIRIFGKIAQVMTKSEITARNFL